MSQVVAATVRELSSLLLTEAFRADRSHSMAELISRVFRPDANMNQRQATAL